MTDILGKNNRVYLKGLEFGEIKWSQIGDILLDDLEAATRMYDLSPLTYIEVK